MSLERFQVTPTTGAHQEMGMGWGEDLEELKEALAGRRVTCVDPGASGNVIFSLTTEDGVRIDVWATGQGWGINECRHFPDNKTGGRDILQYDNIYDIYKDLDRYYPYKGGDPLQVFRGGDLLGFSHPPSGRSWVVAKADLRGQDFSLNEIPRTLFLRDGSSLEFMAKAMTPEPSWARVRETYAVRMWTDRLPPEWKDVAHILQSLEYYDDTIVVPDGDPPIPPWPSEEEVENECERLRLQYEAEDASGYDDKGTENL